MRNAKEVLQYPEQLERVVDLTCGGWGYQRSSEREHHSPETNIGRESGHRTLFQVLEEDWCDGVITRH